MELKCSGIWSEWKDSNCKNGNFTSSRVCNSNLANPFRCIGESTKENSCSFPNTNILSSKYNSCKIENKNSKTFIKELFQLLISHM